MAVAPAHILILGEDEVLRRVIAINLQRRGYIVRQDSLRPAEHNRSLAATIEFAPSLVIIDVEAPSADGFEKPKLLDQLRTGRSGPVILIVADGPVSNRDLARLGASRTLQKPFAIASFLETVDTLLKTA
ncbi:MAG: response regulator [Chloroflexi bacterium]|nr:response regulator [Chloroflexota bacterium]